MLAQEIEALPEVAGIGLQRFRRKPPLGAQMRQPLRHRNRQRVVGAIEFDCLNDLIRFCQRSNTWAMDAVIP